MTKLELFDYFDIKLLDLMIEITRKDDNLKMNEFYDYIGHGETIIDSCFELTDWHFTDYITCLHGFLSYMNRIGFVLKV